MRVGGALIAAALAACGSSEAPRVASGSGSGSATLSAAGSGSASVSASGSGSAAGSASAAELATVTAAALAVEACRIHEATYGYAIDVACPQLAAVSAARKAAPSVHAADLADLAASPSPTVRLYLIHALTADVRAGVVAAEAALVVAITAEPDDSTRNRMIRHLLATGLLAPLRTYATQLLASADPNDRRTGVSHLTTEPLASEPATVTAIGALIAGDPDVGVRARACAGIRDLDATAILPQVDAAIVEPGVNVTIVSGCTDGLAELVGNPKRPAALREAVFTRLLSTLETYPRGEFFPTMSTLYNLTGALEPTLLRPTSTTAEPWFDRARVINVATSIARDQRCHAFARSAAGKLLTALGATPPD